MKKGRICKKQRQAEQLRKKRAQAASALTQGVKKPVAAVPASRPQRPFVGRTTAVSEPLPPMSYPIKKAALGKPQTAGDR